MKEALEAVLERTDIWLMIFTAIVAIGVGGEAVFGVKHWLLSRKLRTILNAEEQKSRAEIARLYEKAGELESTNLLLRTDLERAIGETHSKQTELEVEQRKTAEAQERASRAQLELSQSFGLYVSRSGHRVLKVKELTRISHQVF